MILQSFYKNIMQAGHSSLSYHEDSGCLSPTSVQFVAEVTNELMAYRSGGSSTENAWCEFNRYRANNIYREHRIKMKPLNAEEMEQVLSNLSAKNVTRTDGYLTLLSMEEKEIFEDIIRATLNAANIAAQRNEVTNAQVQIAKDLAEALTRTLLSAVNGYATVYNALGNVFDYLIDKAQEIAY
ncbi:MAG: hypothetical protein K6F71_08565 [Ruminococcus sp.]|uniref:hypothetical protein n=1 Tax=Ruminococcus sp. TaxID=41978 RepID=UPI0025F17839|nr:hypothetical protein [Ruminococcus sp.]MCR5540851.1 hypothetical protein [Ruminococcus sp.]